jgi:hypothetical protein
MAERTECTISLVCVASLAYVANWHFAFAHQSSQPALERERRSAVPATAHTLGRP